MVKAVILNDADNVATLIEKAEKGDKYLPPKTSPGTEIKITTDIPFGHKLAIQSIKEGDLIIKYGRAIGRATQNISAGAHVHEHNCEGLKGRGDMKGGNKR